MATFTQLGKYGRLGNQLWQISCTIAHSIRVGEPFFFPPWPYESYFNLHNCFINSPSFNEKYDEPSFAYRPIPQKKGLNLLGYFQSYKYFDNIEKEIKEYFQPKIIEKQFNNCASIHVRRGDYLIHSGCYEILDMNYYEKAIARVAADKYYIFSDDVKWCKQHFKGTEFIFSENNPDYIDLKHMIQCSHHIIANSSYSWWAGYLGCNPDKKVIAPQKWFGPKLAPTHPTNDLIPEDWEKV